MQNVEILVEIVPIEKKQGALQQQSKSLEKTLAGMCRSITAAMGQVKHAGKDLLDDSGMRAYIRTAEFFEEKLSDSLLCLRLNLGKLKAAFADAVTPIAAVFVPLINQAVMALTGIVSSIAQVVRALLGGIFQMDGLSDSSEKATENQKKLGKAVRSTGKAARRSLAGFDELERLNAPTKGSTGAGGGAAGSVPEMMQPLKEGLQWLVEKLQYLFGLLLAIDLTPLNQALERLKLALEPLTRELFAGLEWAWVNIFVPLAKWTIEDLLPAFLDTLTAALNALNAVITALKPVAVWLWENFLKPVAEWTGGVIIEALGWLKEKLEGVSTWISENQELVQKIGTAVLAVVAAVTLLNLAVGSFGSIGSTGAGAAGLFGNGLSALLNPVNTVVLAVVALVAAIALLIANWDQVKAKAAETWNGIRSTWEKAYSWFKTTVLDPLKNGVRSMANGIIGYLNGMISAAVRAVNTLVRAINTISVTVPEWVPDIGGKRLGFRLKTVSCPQIPYLAQGAVLPANKPFLAMVGDQKHGTNVEAPLATIQEAVAKVLDSHIGAMMAGFEALIAENKALRQTVEGIELGDSTIGEAAARYERKMAVVRGW